MDNIILDCIRDVGEHLDQISIARLLTGSCNISLRLSASGYHGKLAQLHRKDIIKRMNSMIRRRILRLTDANRLVILSENRAKKAAESQSKTIEKRISFLEKHKRPKEPRGPLQVKHPSNARHVSASESSFQSFKTPRKQSEARAQAPAPAATIDDFVTSLPTSALPEASNLLATLSTEQRSIVEAVADGSSVFFTGSAGTGKSHTLRALIRLMVLKYGHGAVFTCASTGIAACNIQGTTVHSFAGIGIGREPEKVLAARVEKSKNASLRWRRCKVLFIDEISMLEGEMFDKLEFIARRIRGRQEAFGGIQLILTGDFFQLPPIGISSGRVRFCFEANTWDRCIRKCVVLKKVFRQREPELIRVLNQLRVGKLTPSAIDLLSGTRNIDTSDGICATHLYSLNKDVDALNSRELSSLQGAVESYSATVGGLEPHRSMLEKNCQAPHTLHLKKGSQVILLKNLDSDRGLVNGARGIVTGFIPNPSYDERSAAAGPKAFPMVQFTSPDGNPFEMKLGLEEWTVEQGGETLAVFRQLPLKLAWALSIHKSQGMTIDKLQVNLRGAFEYGQVYVAASRAKSLDGLRIVGFDPRLVKTHPSVVAFYERIEGGRLFEELEAPIEAAAAAVKKHSSKRSFSLTEEPRKRQRAEAKAVAPQPLPCAVPLQPTPPPPAPTPSSQTTAAPSQSSEFAKSGQMKQDEDHGDLLEGLTASDFFLE